MLALINPLPPTPSLPTMTCNVQKQSDNQRVFKRNCRFPGLCKSFNTFKIVKSIIFIYISF